MSERERVAGATSLTSDGRDRQIRSLAHAAPFDTFDTFDTFDKLRASKLRASKLSASKLKTGASRMRKRVALWALWALWHYSSRNSRVFQGASERQMARWAEDRRSEVRSQEIEYNVKKRTGTLIDADRR